ncbi:MAG: hypothetical protein MUO26_07825 [Methanotrichaceae archaeon]|nr:hypothetical protein [Methanotrichaceae archaeon]
MYHDEDENLSTFLKSFGFTNNEFGEVIEELDAYRSIPGTTLKRYIYRIIETIEIDDRLAFLKGIMVGVAIRKAADVCDEPEITEEEKRIAREIEWLRSSGPKTDHL